MVHQTRALATVIDKRTYCQFDFVPAAAAAAGAALTVTLCIQTKQLDEKYEWNYEELHEKAQTMQSRCTNRHLRGCCATAVRPLAVASPRQSSLLMLFVLHRSV